jgi:hypothetical protein
MKKLFRWSIFSVGCILALGIYAVWKDYDRRHGGGFLTGALRGALIFGGLAILWSWAKSKDQLPKDESAKAVKNQPPIT